MPPKTSCEPMTLSIDANGYIKNGRVAGLILQLETLIEIGAINKFTAKKIAIDVIDTLKPISRVQQLRIVKYTDGDNEDLFN